MKNSVFHQKNNQYIMLQKIGKYIFLIPFMIFGLLHFLNANAMAAMVPNWIPGDMFIVYSVGVCLIAAPIAVFINKWSNLALLLLSALLLLFVFTIHIPAIIGGDQIAMGALLKDLALAGGALYLRK